MATTIKNKVMIITKKEKDTRLGEEVIRISIGGNETVGYYLTYRGDYKKVQELLKISHTAISLLKEELPITPEETRN